MSATAAQVRDSAEQAGSVAAWLRRAGARHEQAGTAARAALVQIPQRWESPESRMVEAHGRACVRPLVPVVGCLEVAGQRMDQLRSFGEDVAARLRHLEHREQDLIRQLGQIAWSTLEPEHQEQVRQRLDAELRDTRRRIDQLGAEWRERSTEVGAVIAQAAQSVREASRGFEEPDWMRRARDIAEALVIAGDAAVKAVDSLMKRFNRWVQVTRQTIVTRVTQVRAQIGRTVTVTVRHAQRTIVTSNLRVWVEAPRWLSRANQVLSKAKVPLKVAGAKLGALGAGLSGYERFQRDADRPDTTRTEQYLRAGVEAAARGVPSYFAGKASVALIAGSVKVGVATGGLGLALVPGAVVASGVLIVGADRAGSRLADKLLDDWEPTQRAIRAAADGIDTTGRAIRDVYNGAVDGISAAGEGLQNLYEGASDRVKGLSWDDLIVPVVPIRPAFDLGRWIP